MVSLVFLIATFEMIKAFLPKSGFGVPAVDDDSLQTSHKPIPYLYVFGLLLSQGRKLLYVFNNNLQTDFYLSNVATFKLRRSNNIEETSNPTGGRYLVFSCFCSEPGI